MEPAKDCNLGRRESAMNEDRSKAGWTRRRVECRPQGVENYEVKCLQRPSP
jgi:hypothetical protein